MKAYIVSLGCPKNLTDAEVLMGKLTASGYSITSKPSTADIIVVNSCAFLKTARDEAISVLREMRSYKKPVYLAGCLPKWMKKNQGGLKLPKIAGTIDSLGLFDYCTPRVKATPPWTAYVKIAEGCSNCCSYCLIPVIRGRLKVRGIEDIIAEVKGLAKRGVKEIVFIAQDTTAHPRLVEILKGSARVRGVKWIRLMYAYPSHISDALIKLMASEKKVVKYLDLPIQHVNSRILKRMNRRYDREQLEKLIARLRKKIPDLALRTSVIVGSPGEAKKEFAELLEFIRSVKFERLGVFKYEREEGTRAAKMAGQVSEREKENRYHALMAAQAKISRELNCRLIGKRIEVLVEGENSGRSYRDAPEIDGRVVLKGRKLLTPGALVKAKVTGAGSYDLTAAQVF